VQAIGRQPHRAQDGASIHCERHGPENTTLYRLVQQHAASFTAHTETNTGAEPPRFMKDEFGAFLECRILAHGILRLRCGECGHNKLLAACSCTAYGVGICTAYGVGCIMSSASQHGVGFRSVPGRHALVT